MNKNTLKSLQERAKELECLYRVNDILSDYNRPLDEILKDIVEALPPGWQHPEHCMARIIFGEDTFESPGFIETECQLSADIMVHDRGAGRLDVCCARQMPQEDHGPFLTEEIKLVKTIAFRLGRFIEQKNLMQTANGSLGAETDDSAASLQNWETLINVLRGIDPVLCWRIATRMLNHLSLIKIDEARSLMQTYWQEMPRTRKRKKFGAAESGDVQLNAFQTRMTFAIFSIAARYYSNEDIKKQIERWIEEDKLSSLIQTINRSLTINEVVESLKKYEDYIKNRQEVHSAFWKNVQVELVRRFLSREKEYVAIARKNLGIGDIYHLLLQVIYSLKGQGRLGGKSAGLYLAGCILKKKSQTDRLMKQVKIPKSWYISSDVFQHFLVNNDLDEITGQKYKNIIQIEFEYPQIVEKIRSAPFPPDIVQALHKILDESEGRPLIVRSSSLLEKSKEFNFSGKYAYVIIANTGTREEVLQDLTAAIAVVFASVFAHDPIAYRKLYQMVDYSEEMGILVQQLVGKQFGKYFFPVCSGTASTKNLIRTSENFNPDEGLIRLVAGCGTRLSKNDGGDYHIFIPIAAGGYEEGPNGFDKVGPEQRMIDVLNLESGLMETLNIEELLNQLRPETHDLSGAGSSKAHGRTDSEENADADRQPSGPRLFYDSTLANTDFYNIVGGILTTLKDAYGYDLNIEFACDGDSFYLLQCSAQCCTTSYPPPPISIDINRSNVMFKISNFVSCNGVIDATHLVIINPEIYDYLENRDNPIDLKHLMARINRWLPERRYALVCPPLWTQVGAFRPGELLSFSELNNAACIMEWMPDTPEKTPNLRYNYHLFNDIMERGIVYIPLDDHECRRLSNHTVVRKAPNLLNEILTEKSYLGEFLKIVNIPYAADKRILKILTNSELNIAMGVIDLPSVRDQDAGIIQNLGMVEQTFYWRWRQQMAERIAEQIDPVNSGITAMYLIGSSKNETAGPGSDIDLLIRFEGNEDQLARIKLWFEGWSQCLAEINFRQTGYRCERLLDLHFVTEDEVRNRSGFAARIDAVTDAAKPLKLRPKTP